LRQHLNMQGEILYAGRGAGTGRHDPDAGRSGAPSYFPLSAGTTRSDSCNQLCGNMAYRQRCTNSLSGERSGDVMMCRVVVLLVMCVMGLGGCLQPVKRGRASEALAVRQQVDTGGMRENPPTPQLFGVDLHLSGSEP
jgi:hypothetical protein